MDDINNQEAKDNTAIHVEGLSVCYGQNIALMDIGLDVREGEYLGIIGPNGGGKTTLLRAILGLVKPACGSIGIYGKSIGEYKASIGYVPQFAGVDRRFPVTVREVVLMGRLRPGLTPFHKFSAKDRDFVDGLLLQVGIEKLAKRQISNLSGGEFQRMLIARALAVNPRFLLLDEPTAGVDAASSEHIYDLLEKLNRQMTIIMVTHDLLAVSSQVKKIACLNKRLIYHGEPELEEGVINTLYGCPVDLIAHGVPHRVLKEHKEGEK